MIGAALEARCAALRQPVVSLVEAGILASTRAAEASALVERIRAVQRVLAQGTHGIAEESYLSWHASAVSTLDRMERAAQTGDAAEAWRLFTDPTTGFYPLSVTCQGQPGW